MYIALPILSYLKYLPLCCCPLITLYYLPLTFLREYFMLLPRLLIVNMDLCFPLWYGIVEAMIIISPFRLVINCCFFLLDYHFYSYCSLHPSSFSGRPKEQILDSTLHDKKPIEPSLLPSQQQRELFENRSQQLHNVLMNVCILSPVLLIVIISFQYIVVYGACAFLSCS